MTPMPITDSMFLMLESREQPMHVGALQLFDRPQDADPDFLAELWQRLVTASGGIDHPFGCRVRRTARSLGQWAWSPDEHLDLAYHVRRSALPRPGRLGELLELVSRLHSAPLDRHHPLWEMHLVEGRAEGRFAVCTKVHHAVNDGVSALRRLGRTLSEDPQARALPPPWSVDTLARGCAPPADGDHTGGDDHTGGVAAPLRAAGTIAHALADLLGLPPAVLAAVGDGVGGDAVRPLRAPRSALNVATTGARCLAAGSWPLERLAAVRAATGATVNDVVLAMSAGALRRHLLERHALPDRPLVAMVPVSIRSSAEGTGNAFGTILCDLATDTADPEQRYRRILRSMRQGKRLFDGLSRVQSTVLSAALCAPLAGALLPGAPRGLPPPFNVIISNVPGPDTTMYWHGARLRQMYPMSLLLPGQALNITVSTYDGNLHAGLVGCRRAVPELPRLLTHLDSALTELEVALVGG